MSKSICCPVSSISSLEPISALIAEITLHISSAVYRPSVTSETQSEERLCLQWNLFPNFYSSSNTFTWGKIIFLVDNGDLVKRQSEFNAFA